MDLLDRLAARFAGTKLTGRGIAFVVAGILAFLVSYASGWAALLAVSLFLGGLVVAALASVVVAPPALTIARRIDPTVTEQRSPVRVRVTVHGDAGGTLDWAERVPHGVAANGRTSGRLEMRDRSALLEYEVVARRRGAVPLGPFGVVRSDPLGLAVTRREIGSPDRIVVLPTLHPLAVPAVITRTDPDSSASTAFGPIGDQRDIVARTYRAGDPMRQVDWRATAHRGELMVRTEAAAAASSTALALETRWDAWPDEQSFEWAVEFAASMASALGERRAVVRFATDRRAPVTEDPLDALVALALATRNSADPRSPELAARLLATDVRVVHVVTGPGAAADLARLPSVPQGTVGLVSLVGRIAAPPTAPRGWRVALLDPSAPVSEARIDV